MNKNKIAIESLSMDLQRIANGYHRGSDKMAERFVLEAKKRLKEIKKSQVEPFFQKTLNKIQLCLEKINRNRIAEDALMYSTLCRNYTKVYA